VRDFASSRLVASTIFQKQIFKDLRSQGPAFLNALKRNKH